MPHVYESLSLRNSHSRVSWFLAFVGTDVEFAQTLEDRCHLCDLKRPGSAETGSKYFWELVHISVQVCFQWIRKAVPTISNQKPKLRGDQCPENLGLSARDPLP